MIRLIDVHKTFKQGASEVTALAGVSLEIAKGEFVAVMGPSGSGKSTLLHLIGGLDRPTRGDVAIGGKVISQMGDDEVTLFRREKIGFVFQFFNLLPTLTAIENAMLPAILDGRAETEARAKAAALLERVGLSGRSNHLPEQLSGGEIQRLAIAARWYSARRLCSRMSPPGTSIPRPAAQFYNCCATSTGKKTRPW